MNNHRALQSSVWFLDLPQWIFWLETLFVVDLFAIICLIIQSERSWNWVLVIRCCYCCLFFVVVLSVPFICMRNRAIPWWLPAKIYVCDRWLGRKKNMHRKRKQNVCNYDNGHAYWFYATCANVSGYRIYLISHRNRHRPYTEYMCVSNYFHWKEPLKWTKKRVNTAESK